jgi:ribosomal protein S18 acetylase RimI-like enzyme
MKFTTRRFIRGDIDEVLDIEAYSFDQPWARKDFVTLLRHPNVVNRVALIDGVIVAYASIELYGRRADILNFAVRWDYRRQGIGREFLRHLRHTSLNDRSAISFAVSEYNASGQIFLRSCKFRVTSIMREHYEGSDEDSYYFEWVPGQPPQKYLPCNRISGYI